MNLIFRDIDDISILHDDGVLLLAKAVGHNWYATDSVLNSYGNDRHPVIRLIDEKMVKLQSFSSEFFCEIEKLYSKHKGLLSLTDCSVIFCATVTKGILITKEKILMDISNQYDITTNTANNYSKEVKLYKTEQYGIKKTRKNLAL